MDWVDLYNRLGLPTLLVAGLLFGTWRAAPKVWPVVVDWLERNAKERDQYLATLTSMAAERNLVAQAAQTALAHAEERAVEDRMHFLKSIADQSDAHRSSSTAIVSAVGALTQQISSLHDMEAANQREILKVLSELQMRAKRK